MHRPSVPAHLLSGPFSRVPDARFYPTFCSVVGSDAGMRGGGRVSRSTLNRLGFTLRACKTVGTRARSPRRQRRFRMEVSAESPQICMLSRAICQEVDHLMAFEVNDDRSIAHSLLLGPIINPDHANEAVVGVSRAAPLDHSPDRDAVDRHAETPHQLLCRSPAGGVSAEPNDPGQTGGPARIRRRRVGKPFRKDPLSAVVIAAPPAGQPRLDLDRHSLDREIMGSSQIGLNERTVLFCSRRPSQTWGC